MRFISPDELVGTTSFARTLSSALPCAPIPRKNAAADVVFQERPVRGIEVGTNGNVTAPALVRGDKLLQHLLPRGIFVRKHRAGTQAALGCHHPKPSSRVAAWHGPIAEEIMNTRCLSTISPWHCWESALRRALSSADWPSSPTGPQGRSNRSLTTLTARQPRPCLTSADRPRRVDG